MKVDEVHKEDRADNGLFGRSNTMGRKMSPLNKGQRSGRNQ